MYYEMLQNMARSGMTKNANFFFNLPANIIASSLAGGLIGAGLDSEDPAKGAALGAGTLPAVTSTIASAIFNRKGLKNDLKNLFTRGNVLSVPKKLLRVLSYSTPIGRPLDYAAFASIPTAAAYGLGKVYENFREKENKE